MLRVWIYRSLLGIPNSDESIVGLMVLHAMHGKLTTFYWGSPYAGPQEVLLSVPVFAVAGVNYLALRVVPIALSAVAAIVVWRVGRRTIGEPGAVAAAGLLWLWPPFNLFQLTQQQSFYAADVFYCALLLLLGLRIVEAADARNRVGLLRVRARPRLLGDAADRPDRGPGDRLGDLDGAAGRPARLARGAARASSGRFPGSSGTRGTAGPRWACTTRPPRTSTACGCSPRRSAPDDARAARRRSAQTLILPSRVVVDAIYAGLCRPVRRSGRHGSGGARHRSSTWSPPCSRSSTRSTAGPRSSPAGPSTRWS